MTRVLIVDDDPVVRVALENLMAALDWDVTSVPDVTSALLALLPDEQGGYDAAVLDHDLPDGSGTEVAQVLALMHPGAHVVMHTSRDLLCLPGGVATLVPKRRGPLAVLDHLQAHRTPSHGMPADPLPAQREPALSGPAEQPA